MIKYYLVRITLVNSDPVIWRRVYMPDDITLEDLHWVIQTIMKWKNDHLHEFLLGDKSLTPSVMPFLSDSQEDEHVLKDYLPLANPKKPLYYVYDFGDNWVHEIALEDENYQKAEDSPDIVCIDGELAAPPDNIGGVHEYAYVYELLKKKEELPSPLNRWFKKDYDPDFFDIEAINVKLSDYSCDGYVDPESLILHAKKKKARAKKKAARQNKKVNRNRKKK